MASYWPFEDVASLPEVKRKHSWNFGKSSHLEMLRVSYLWKNLATNLLSGQVITYILRYFLPQFESSRYIVHAFISGGFKIKLGNWAIFRRVIGQYLLSLLLIYIFLQLAYSTDKLSWWGLLVIPLSFQGHRQLFYSDTIFAWLMLSPKALLDLL